MNKLKLRKALKNVKKNLVRDKMINSPIFYIKSKHKEIPTVVVPLFFNDEESKRSRTIEVHEICQQIDANEILIVSSAYLYKGDSMVPASEALIASIENAKGIQNVTLPYKKGANEKIEFGKEVWQWKTVKDPDSLWEGFIQ